MLRTRLSDVPPWWMFRLGLQCCCRASRRRRRRRRCRAPPALLPPRLPVDGNPFFDVIKCTPRTNASVGWRRRLSAAADRGARSAFVAREQREGVEEVGGGGSKPGRTVSRDAPRSANARGTPPPACERGVAMTIALSRQNSCAVLSPRRAGLRHAKGSTAAPRQRVHVASCAAFVAVHDPSFRISRKHSCRAAPVPTRAVSRAVPLSPHSARPPRRAAPPEPRRGEGAFARRLRARAASGYFGRARAARRAPTAKPLFGALGDRRAAVRAARTAPPPPVGTGAERRLFDGAAREPAERNRGFHVMQ